MDGAEFRQAVVITKKVRPVLEVADDIAARSRAGSLTLRDVFEIRQQLRGLTGSGGPQAVAARAAMRGLDDAERQISKLPRFANDPTSKLWREAIRARRVQALRFERGITDDLTKRSKEFSGKNALDPSDAANAVLGASDLGFITRQELVRDLARLRRQVGGAQSDEWGAIRAEIFQRHGRTSQGGFRGGERGFSGVKFAKAWQALNERNPRLGDLLFTKEEIGTINRLVKAALDITSPQPGAVNTSNSAIFLKRAAGRLPFLRYVPGGQELVQAILNLKGGIDASRVIKGGAQPPKGGFHASVTPVAAPLMGLERGMEQ